MPGGPHRRLTPGRTLIPWACTGPAWPGARLLLRAGVDGALLAACTEMRDDPKPPWQVRKESYLNHLRQSEDRAALRVSLADKLDNVRSMVADHRRMGDRLFDRFNVPKASQRWYYEQLVEAFSSSPLQSVMVDELGERVTVLFEGDARHDRHL